jgi:hypothetical protein
METLRRAQERYRPRWHVVPDRYSITLIAARDVIHYQLYQKPGSWLWAVSAAASAGEVNTSDFSITIRESCSNIPLWDQAASAADVRSPIAGATLGVDTDFNLPPFAVLPEPRLILEPGLVHVEIWNTSAFSGACQVMLFFAEPKESKEEAAR